MALKHLAAARCHLPQTQGTVQTGAGQPVSSAIKLHRSYRVGVAFPGGQQIAVYMPQPNLLIDTGRCNAGPIWAEGNIHNRGLDAESTVKPDPPGTTA